MLSVQLKKITETIIAIDHAIGGPFINFWV
jgi:hypothetical protein